MIQLMAKKTGETAYTEAFTVRFPQKIADTMHSFIQRKKEDYPKYAEADLIRTAVVKFLKEKGLLEKDKQYL